jgi:transposase InsO family protein
MTEFHNIHSKPSILLALVCLAVVRRVRPGWISITLDEAARSENVSPQRLSRLCAGAILLFQGVLDTLTRIGRPNREKEEEAALLDNVLLRSLLGVATDILRHVSLCKPAIRALLIGAYLRLKQEHPELKKEKFCEVLALSPRTFRDWMRRPSKTEAQLPVAPPSDKKPPAKRPPRRPRFGFDVTLPDTQIAADTTDLEAFGVKLKLVAAQDIGGRDQCLFDSVIIDHRESADLVVRAVKEAIDGKEGMQVITDQGTPYMAEITKAALDEMGAEHAPQKEGDPQGKATIERAFGIVKQIAKPILALTSKIAASVPQLKDREIAKATATLLLVALLKAYQAGARAARRADDQRASVSPSDLEDLAERSRQRARAESRSVRLLLTHIHGDYKINRPLATFIKQMRRFPLNVLKEAERAFSSQVHRDDLRDRASYFAAVARRCNEAYLRKTEIEQRKREENQESAQHIQNTTAIHKARLAEPVAWIVEALNAIAIQWIPERGALLFNGAGLGKGHLINAIDRLLELNGPTSTADIAFGILAQFEKNESGRLSPQCLQSIRNLFEKTLDAKLKKQTDCNRSLSPVILQNNGP